MIFLNPGLDCQSLLIEQRVSISLPMNDAIDIAGKIFVAATGANLKKDWYFVLIMGYFGLI